MNSRLRRRSNRQQVIAEERAVVADLIEIRVGVGELKQQLAGARPTANGVRTNQFG